VQPILIRTEELIGDPALRERDDNGLFITFTPNPSELPIAIRKLWGMVLRMAVYERATSVHYHPWRNEWVLTFIVDGTQYELVPPPPERSNIILDVFRALFIAPSAGFFSRLFRRFSGHATIRVDVDGTPILWDAICWSSDDRRSVELFRITPLEPRTPAE
jgi:hypothetical protein